MCFRTLIPQDWVHRSQIHFLCQIAQVGWVQPRSTVSRNSEKNVQISNQFHLFYVFFTNISINVRMKRKQSYSKVIVIVNLSREFDMYNIRINQRLIRTEETKFSRLIIQSISQRVSSIITILLCAELKHDGKLKTAFTDTTKSDEIEMDSPRTLRQTRLEN